MVNDFSSFKTSFVEVGPQGPQGIPGPQGPQGPQGKDSLEYVELPQKWHDINQAYEDFGEPGHKLKGGLIYKDFDGNIKVYPLSPAYGVRTDECGEKLDSVAVYNTAQQLMVKPATDGRHTVCLRQLDEFFGGGLTSNLGEKAYSLQKIPPVDLTPPINERKCYVFCRDSQNKFAPKYYGEVTDGETLAERDSEGRLRANAPDTGSMAFNDYLVNVDYLNRKLNSYLPLSGGTMTGTPTIKKNSPALALQNTSDNTSAYVQLYKQRLRLGYTWTNALAVDKDGNVEVSGNLIVGGNISADPATDGKHAISLRQLDEFFGGGSTSEVGESVFSLQKIPPVDLTPPINERKCYVFCRDSQNKFAPKFYSEPSFPNELAERDGAGRLRANAPDADSMPFNDYLVNIEYFNRKLNSNTLDSLTSYSTTRPLSANQGRVLKQSIDTKVAKSQLNQIFGGGNNNGELDIIPPVDTTPPVNERQPYVFCRDSSNKFAGKVYSVTTIPRTLVERDEYGYFQVNYPASEYNPVNLGHLTNPAKLNVGFVGGDEYEIVSCGSILDPTLHIPRFIGDVEIQTIGARAFKSISGLREVIISPSIRYIGTAAFYGCHSLTYVSFDRHSNLHTIGANAFENCYGLKEIELPESLDAIDGDAFYGCSSLLNITIPKNVKTIGKNAFANAGLTRVVFEGIEPPTFGAGGVQYNFTAVVPKGTIDAYRAQSALTNCNFEEYTV